MRNADIEVVDRLEGQSQAGLRYDPPGKTMLQCLQEIFQAIVLLEHQLCTVVSEAWLHPQG